MQAQKSYLDYLVDPIFQGVNKLTFLLFESNTDKIISFAGY